MLKWIKDKYFSFEAWVHGFAPGLKTYIISIAGMVGNSALLLQEYIKGLPLEYFFSPTSLLILNAVLFTLAYWFRGMGDRVDAREAV